MIQFIKIDNYVWSVHKHPEFYRTFVARIEMIVSGFIKGTKCYSARIIKIV
jgi:hypothetical protein